MEEVEGLIRLYRALARLQLKPKSARGVSHNTAYMATVINSLILASWWSKMTTVTTYPWPRGKHGKIQPQRRQPDSREGRTQIAQFTWNCELSVKLGADESGAQWAASQNSNSVIDESFPKRRKHGFALRFWYGKPSFKNQWGRGDRRLNFLKRQLSCDWQHTIPSSRQKNRMIGMRWIAEE